jgi:hypothetical protein
MDASAKPQPSGLQYTAPDLLSDGGAAVPGATEVEGVHEGGLQLHGLQDVHLPTERPLPVHLHRHPSTAPSKLLVNMLILVVLAVYRDRMVACCCMLVGGVIVQSPRVYPALDYPVLAHIRLKVVSSDHGQTIQSGFVNPASRQSGHLSMGTVVAG